MGSLKDAKYIGGVGSILILLGIMPNVGFLLGIIGWILVLIAIKWISDVIRDVKVFKNMLYAVIIIAAGAAITGILILSTITSSLFLFLQTIP